MSRHRDDLQGLRAVAVLLVCLGHAGVRFFAGGYVGVDVFFVLSGFLITGLLLAGALRRGVAFLAEFYVRRARRILPAAALTLVVTILAAYWLLNVVRARQAAWDGIWAAFFAANVHFAREATDYFARSQPPSPVLHFWSLAVEEQFYLVWPALLCLVLFGWRGLRRRRGEATAGGLRRLLVAIVLAGAASLAWSIYDTRRSPNSAYFSPFARAWELALGAALAIATPTLMRAAPRLRAGMGWVGLLAIASATVSFSGGTAFPGYAALLPTVGAALVIGAGVGDEQPRLGVGRLLALAPMRYVGDRSYALYLWHWPVLVIALQYEQRALSVGVKLVLLVGAFLLSVASYRYFENPLRRSSWRPNTGLLLWPATAAAVVVVAATALHGIHDKVAHLDSAAAAASGLTAQAPAVGGGTDPSVVSTVIASVKAAQAGAPLPAPLVPPVDRLLDDRYVFPGGCAPADSQARSRVCRFETRGSRRSLVLIGDSHAQMWMPALLEVARAEHFTLVPLTKSGCNPDEWVKPIEGYPAPTTPAPSVCRAWYAWVVHEVRVLHPAVVLATGAYGAALGPRQKAIVGAFSALTTSIHRSAGRLVVIGDAPARTQQPVDCLLASGATMKTCTSTWTWQRSAIDAVAATIERRGAGFIDVTRWFCYQTLCPMVIGHTIAYVDTGHLTRTYARDLGGVFGAALRRVLARRR